MTGVRLARHPIGSCSAGHFQLRLSPRGRLALFWIGNLTGPGVFAGELVRLIDWHRLARQRATNPDRKAVFVLAVLDNAAYAVEPDRDGGETLYRIEPHRPRIFLRRPGAREDRAPIPSGRRAIRA